MGRPTKYTPALARQICDRLADGESLRRICQSPQMPGIRTVFSWLDRDQAFQQQYARAREEQAELYAYEIIDIADAEAIKRNVPSPDGGVDECIDPAGEQWRKTRIDARKWYASKLAPKKYGDLKQVEHSGSVTLEGLVCGPDSE